MTSLPDDPNSPKGLGAISTHWSEVHQPAQFVLRYAPAIQGYLEALLSDPNDVEEVRQAFLLRVVQQGLVEPGRVHGRFRDYLIAAVRDAAVSHLRRNRHPREEHLDLDHLPAPLGPDPLDRQWLDHWRRCLLAAAWERLDRHEQDAPDSHYYTVLRLTAEHPGECSETLAAQASAQTGRTIRPDAFRKQLSRARRLFAALLVQEVARTLEDASPARIEEELIDLGLLKYVRPFLPQEQLRIALGGRAG
jgi:DNA-directed RNA polymerase specialized sigma24 family protein